MMTNGPFPAVPRTPGAAPPRLAERWFRTYPDSSVLARPRLLARSLIDVADLDEQIEFYQRLLGVPADLRMPIPDFGGLELAAIGGLLLIASERAFTPIQRQTAYSLIVPSLHRSLERVAELGGTVLEPPESIVPGARARVRYPDNCLAELVEHRPRPGERPQRSPVSSRCEGSPCARLLARRRVPRDSFDEALAWYGRALETTAHRTWLGGPAGIELAIVGNLLLVASEAADPAVGAPAFALIVLKPAAGRAAIALIGPGPELVTLPNGQRAEVWEADQVPA